MMKMIMIHSWWLQWWWWWGSIYYNSAAVFVSVCPHHVQRGVCLCVCTTWLEKNEHFPSGSVGAPSKRGENEHILKQVSWGPPPWDTKNHDFLKRVSWDPSWEYPIRGERRRCEERRWEHPKMYPLELYPLAPQPCPIGLAGHWPALA